MCGISLQDLHLIVVKIYFEGKNRNGISLHRVISVRNFYSAEKVASGCESLVILVLFN